MLTEHQMPKVANYQLCLASTKQLVRFVNFYLCLFIQLTSLLALWAVLRKHASDASDDGGFSMKTYDLNNFK